MSAHCHQAGHKLETPSNQSMYIIACRTLLDFPSCVRNTWSPCTQHRRIVLGSRNLRFCKTLGDHLFFHDLRVHAPNSASDGACLQVRELHSCHNYRLHTSCASKQNLLPCVFHKWLDVCPARRKLRSRNIRRSCKICRLGSPFQQPRAFCRKPQSSLHTQTCIAFRNRQFGKP